MLKSSYYHLRPFIPRIAQIALRRMVINRKRALCAGIWPIDENAGKPPEGFSGWPDKKKFALVLTHDIETAKGLGKCHKLAKLDEEFGFKSSFSFVPKRYSVPPELRRQLVSKGFEVGVHGLYHDGKLYMSKKIFQSRAKEINAYIKEWEAKGFRSPSMHNKLEWIHELNIEYDSSTFDTDPFEPESKGMGTIFPFRVSKDSAGDKGYIELPYTLPQDFTLFILMKEKNIDIWKQKLDWIVKKGGMALVVAHPDYMNFGNLKLGIDEYPVDYYIDFLNYVKKEYKGQYWTALPENIALFWRKNHLSSLPLQKGD